MSFWEHPIVVRAIDGLIQHGLLLAAILAILVAGLVWTAWSLRKALPTILKAFFSNGGGEIVSGIVSVENAKQVEHIQDRTKQAIQEAIAQHERYEDERWKRLEDDQTRLDDRVRRLETKGRRRKA